MGGISLGGGSPRIGSIGDLEGISGTEPIDDTTSVTGSADAAEVETGDFRKDVDIYFSATTGNDDIIVQVSNDAITWRTVQQLNVASGGESDLAQFNFAWRYVRAYPGGGFADSEINEVTVSAKGL